MPTDDPYIRLAVAYLILGVSGIVTLAEVKISATVYLNLHVLPEMSRKMRVSEIPGCRNSPLPKVLKKTEAFLPSHYHQEVEETPDGCSLTAL
jgi:hypothetical protein